MDHHRGHTETATHLSVLMVDHDIVWLDVSVHDSHAVTIVEGSQQLIQVVANIIVCQLLIECLPADKHNEGNTRILQHHVNELTLKSVLSMYSKMSAGVLDCNRS